MKKALRLGWKSMRILLTAALCFFVFEMGYVLFNFSPAKWYVRFNCLCGRAHFHAGERFAPDTILFNEIGQQELSDEHITILAQPCKRHEERLLITIYGSKEYSVRVMGQ